MNLRSDLIRVIIVCVLTCSNPVRTDSTADVPTNASTVTGPDNNATSTSAEDIFLSSSTAPATTTTTTTTTEATTTLTPLTTTSTATTTAHSILPSITTTSTVSTTETSETTTTTTATPGPTTTATPGPTTTATPGPTTTAGAATLCPSVEESFFGKYGLIVFIVALGVILLLLYTILMLLLLPRILNRSRKGGKYTVSKGGRKSKEHQGLPPLAIGIDEDTQSTSKVMDPGPLMLVTAMDSVTFASEQDDEDDDDGDGQSNGPLNPGKDDTRKDSSDQGNVSTFLLRQTSIRQAQEKRRMEAEEKQNGGTSETEGRTTAALVTTGNSSQIDGNDNLVDGLMTPALSSPLYGVTNDITEV